MLITRCLACVIAITPRAMALRDGYAIDAMRYCLLLMSRAQVILRDAMLRHDYAD